MQLQVVQVQLRDKVKALLFTHQDHIYIVKNFPMDSVSQGSYRYELMIQATRLLAENVTDSEAPTTSPTSESGALVQSNDAEIIRDTLRVYGSIYLGCFLMFCVVRRRYPKLYNLRSWVPEMKSDLTITTTQSYGFFSWAWKSFRSTMIHC